MVILECSKLPPCQFLTFQVENTFVLMPSFFSHILSHHKTPPLTEAIMNSVQQVETHCCSYLNAIKPVTTFCFGWGFFGRRVEMLVYLFFYPFSSLGLVFSLHFLLLIQFSFYNAFDSRLTQRRLWRTDW